MTAPEIPHSVDVHPNGLHVIDTGFVAPHMAAAYLLVEQGRAAFIETGTARSVPRLLQGPGRRGPRSGARWTSSSSPTSTSTTPAAPGP